MTKAEFAAAFELAHADDVSWSDVDDSMLHGCALPDFQPVHTTLLSVARLIRWQCLFMFRDAAGRQQWDAAELHSLALIAKRRFTLIEDAAAALARSTGRVA